MGFKFELGDRVKSTAEAREWGLYAFQKGPQLGTVTGFSRDGCVRVLRDGLKTSASYAMSLWERIDESQTKAP